MRMAAYCNSFFLNMTFLFGITDGVKVQLITSTGSLCVYGYVTVRMWRDV